MFKRIVLFSQPTPDILEKLSIDLFPQYITNPVFGYMPSDGSSPSNPKYIPTWQKLARSHQAEFVPIDNSQRGLAAQKEIDKLLASNILLITGGNTFILLKHLKESGLFQALLTYWKTKSNIVLSGFSAGAIVLTPTIGTAVSIDPNPHQTHDLSALKIVNFEVWPHYTSSQIDKFHNYSQQSPFPVKQLTDSDVLVINQ